MRLPPPRIIAIDDEPKHLQGLSQGLNRYGAACLPVLFAGEGDIAPCSYVRVVFADLHLGGGPPGDHAQDFAIIGGLIEDMIQPSGPYFIVLWTRYPDQATALHEFLVERLQNVAKPFTVQALNKNDHLDPQGDVRNPQALVEAIGQIVAAQPQIGALLNWEERVLGATADTLSSITAMAEAAAAEAGPDVELGRLLSSLAAEAVGSEHVEHDRFRALNEALLPILGDRIASMRSLEPDDELWQAAFGGVDVERRLALDEAASLNRLLHIEPSTPDDDGGQRGTVIALPDEFLGEGFAATFDLNPEVAMEKQFRCRSPAEEDGDPVRWVLVQTQAACDYAQNQPGPLPFHLGLCLPASRAARNRIPPAALWCSPCFKYENNASFLHVSARFPVSLSRERTRLVLPLFRLREQLLNDLTYKIHSYGSRPGVISFR